MRLLLIFYFIGFFFKIIAQDNQCETNYDKKSDKLYKDAEKKFNARLYSEATFLLKKLIEEEENHYQAYYLLGSLNFEKLNFFYADKYLKKSIALCPSYKMKAYYFLASMSFNSEKYDETLNYLKIYLNDIEKTETEKEFKEQDYKDALRMEKYAKNYLDLTSKPVPFNPVLVPGISSKFDEYLPIITPDNEMALYTRRIPYEQKTAWVSEQKFKEVFTFSLRDKKGRYDAGATMPRPFNVNDNEGGATLTVDNKQLFYTLCKYNNNNSYLNCDIYFSEYKNGIWGDIKALDENINSPKSWESQPTVTSDGKTLYFISDRDGGTGGYDIYISRKDNNNKWSKAECLGTEINSKGNEKSPFIHTDSQTLYFSSDGWGGLGGYDIFYTRMGNDNKWEKPKNIGYPINTTSDDVGFFVSTDGNYGYFASNTLKGLGGWDVYSFELYKEARPQKVILIKGVIKDDSLNKPLPAKIELQNMQTRNISHIPVDSVTGEYAVAVLFKDDYLLTVKKEGYAYSSKYISTEDTTIETNTKIDMEIKELKVGNAYKLNDIYFQTDSFALTEESKLVINDFINYLNENKNMKIAIYGHTDNVGDASYNLSLSENRAKSVFEYIIKQGIEKTRLNYKGFGMTKPVDTNNTPEGKAKNRRTEFYILEK
ncbi:MAG: OmpA family protein [Bacteroidales bacterium]|nr:OmpA family protein [Bacteroidales bacterium]